MDVILAGSAEEDFEDYYKIKCGDSDIYWMGFEGKPDRETLYRCFMSRLGDSPLEKEGDKRIYMIKSLADGEVKNVGVIQFTIDPVGLEFGISVGEEHQGKGYGPKGVALAVELAKQYGRTVYARIRDDNYPSQQCFLKNGFVRTEEYEMVNYPRAGEEKFRKYLFAEAAE